MATKRRRLKQTHGMRLKVQTPSGLWMTRDVTPIPGINYQEFLVNMAKGLASQFGTAACVETEWGAQVAYIRCPYAAGHYHRPRDNRRPASVGGRFDKKAMMLMNVSVQRIKGKMAPRKVRA